MDYEWKYFVEDLSKTVKEQKVAADAVAQKEISHPLPEETIKVLRDSLVGGYRGYREAVGEHRQALDHLLAVHTEVCRIMPWDGLLKRRHNALVYRYVVSTVAGNRAVAKILSISKDTLYVDLDGAIRDMLILCIGLPYLFQGGKSDILATVKLIVRNYPLLDRFEQLEESLCLFPVNLRSSIREAREATRRSMQLFGRILTIYREFCEENDISGINERRQYLLEQNMKGESRAVREVAEKYNCSSETVYLDMKENEKRLSELMSTISACKGAPCVAFGKIRNKQFKVK